MIRREYDFLGRVQGVGFRFKTEYSANMLGLTGWVENEYDGSVKAQIQGEPVQIEKMIQMLQHDRYIEIEQMSCREIPLEEHEYQFHIK